MHEPRDEYKARLLERRATVAQLDRWDRALSWARGLLIFSAAFLAWLAWRRHLVPATTLLVPGFGFLAAVVVHDRIARRQTRARRAVQLYERALARLDDKWAQLPLDGARFLDAGHPYAADLDLFGAHSLFQLLCTARTAPGEATLARWLTGAAPPAEIRSRQAAVKELAPHLDLREQLWIAGLDVRAGVDSEQLQAWGAAPSVLPGGWLRAMLLLLCIAMMVTGLGWMTGRLPAAAPALTAAIVLIVTQILNARTSAVVGAGAQPDTHLSLLAELVLIFERAYATATPAFQSEAVQDLHLRLTKGPWEGPLNPPRDGAGEPSSPAPTRVLTDGRSASRQIARLGRLVRLMAWQHNLVFTPIGYALLWRPQFAAAIEAWRRRNGPRVAIWIQALADLEALAALATFSYDHPDRPFPQIVPEADGPTYVATALFHPLLPGCVANDIHLGGTRPAPGARLMVLSGSNMSGKSTLMRTVGINAVLALAGAPVCASALTLSPLTVGATLRIQDSLAAGTSRFYAEITRLRQLVDLARGSHPLLFLIDEILAGTNSHDRRLGAISVLGGLVKLGAVGIASTHDLALTDVVGQLPGQALNYHFQDDLKDGVLTFDYHLREGVVQRSNALALMRAVGLDV